MGYIWLPGNSVGPNAQGIFSLFNNSNTSVGIPGTDPSSAPFNGRLDQWIPFTTTLKSWYLHITTPPGAAKTLNVRVHDDSGGDVSTIQQIVGASSQDVSNSIEEDLVGIDPLNDTSILNSRLYASAWASTSGNASGTGIPAFEYFDATHPGYLWWVTNSLVGATFSASAAYANLHDTAISSGATTQQVKQIRCPIKGKLKYAFAVWRGYVAATTVEACLQLGTIGAGADTTILLTMPGQAATGFLQATTPSTTEVAVAEGDYLNWRVQRTAGAATSGFISLVVGFAPGL